MARDLSIIKHPLIIGRKWPSKVHHMTQIEFGSFLTEHRFPSHTHNDQQVSRRRYCVDQIAKGEQLPAEVIDEDPSLLKDGQDQRLASEAAVSFYDLYQKHLKLEREAFERDLGYCHSHTVYRNALTNLLKATVTSGVPFGQKSTSVLHEGRQLCLKIVESKQPQKGVFGTYGGAPKRLQIIRGAADIGLVLHTVPFDLIDNLLTELLASKQVTYDQIWNLAGLSWRPQGKAVITRIESRPATA